VAARSLVALRHGRPKASGVCYGRSDVEVVDADEDALGRLRLALARAIDERVWSSPSRRCRTLAEALAGGRVTVDPRLAELDFGRWEGRAWDAIHRDEPGALARWSADYVGIAPPGGETVATLEDRVRDFVRALSPASCHLLVTHAGVIRCLWVLAGVCTWRSALERPVPHLEPIAIAL
jgi:alpha-ribazole phosphatase